MKAEERGFKLFTENKLCEVREDTAASKCSLFYPKKNPVGLFICLKTYEDFQNNLILWAGATFFFNEKVMVLKSDSQV